MVRRTVPVAIALAAAVTLLSGCGGDSSSDDIKGADDSAEPSASVSREAPPSDRPDVSLPDDLHAEFDAPKPSDPDHAAALADAENYLRALDHGITQQDPDDPAYRYYSTGSATRYAKTQITAWVNDGWTATGTEKFYRSKTADVGSNGVLVTLCRNQAKFYGKNVKTQKIKYTEENLDSYQKYSLLMRPAADAGKTWKVQQIEVQGRVKECRQ